MMTAKAESVDVKTNVVMNLKNFTIDEFDSPDLPGSGLNMDNDFLQMLDMAREIANIPFIYTFYICIVNLRQIIIINFF
mgnify:CR=1 FL=1